MNKSRTETGLPRKWGIFLLALWLIGGGVLALAGIRISYGDILLNVLAVTAGFLLRFSHSIMAQ